MPIAVSVVPQFAQVVTINFGSAGGDDTLTTAATVPGALPNHIYLAVPEVIATWNEGLSFPIGYGTDANEVTFRFSNSTGGALNPAEQDFKILGF